LPPQRLWGRWESHIVSEPYQIESVMSISSAYGV
jgi:hypothetical protein